jgi:hypothetical protein
VAKILNFFCFNFFFLFKNLKNVSLCALNDRIYFKMIIFVIKCSLLRNPTSCRINFCPFHYWRYPKIHQEFVSLKVERLNSNFIEENEINWVK